MAAGLNIPYGAQWILLAGAVLWLAASLQQLLAQRLGGRRLGGSGGSSRANVDDEPGAVGRAAPSTLGLGDRDDRDSTGAPSPRAPGAAPTEGLRQRVPPQPFAAAERQPPGQDPRTARGALLSRLESQNAASAAAAAASAAAPHWGSAFAGGSLEQALDEMVAGRVACLLLWLDGSDSVALDACRNTLPSLSRALLEASPRPHALRLDAASAEGAFVRADLLGATSMPALLLVWGPSPKSRVVLRRAQLARPPGALVALADAAAAARLSGPYGARAAGVQLRMALRQFAARSALALGRPVGGVPAARARGAALAGLAVVVPSALTGGARVDLLSEQDAAFAAALLADQAAEAAVAAEAVEAAGRASALEARLERRRALLAHLGAEPERDAADALNVVVRLSSGRRLARRWRADATIASVCAWLRASCDDEAVAGRFVLVCAFPRAVVGASDDAEATGGPASASAQLGDVFPGAERSAGGTVLLDIEPYGDSD
jgi:hypothetical protein